MKLCSSASAQCALLTELGACSTSASSLAPVWGGVHGSTSWTSCTAARPRVALLHPTDAL